MAAAARPLRTLTALAKLFGSRWADLTQLEVSDTAIKVAFADPKPALPLEQPAPQPHSQFKNPEQQEPPLNDADLALSPPAGMLLPPPPEEQN